MKAPVWAFFDERQDTTLQCDASQTALGAALLQNGRPVAYTSRALSAAECHYAQIEGALCTAAVYSLSSLLSFSICFIVSSLVVLSLSNCPHLEQAAFFCHLFYVSLFLSIRSSTPLCLWYVHLWSILVIFSHSIGRLPHFYLYFFLFVLFHFPEERPPISFMLLANPL